MTEKELEQIKQQLVELPTITELRNAYALTEDNKVSLIFEINYDDDQVMAVNIDYNVIHNVIHALTMLKQHLENTK